MEEIKCTCGHLLSNNSDQLPYGAWVIPDQQTEAGFETIIKVIDEVLESKRTGELVEGLQGHFQDFSSFEANPESLNVIQVLITKSADVGREMYECEACGRLLVENGDDFLIYQRESADQEKGILTAPS